MREYADFLAQKRIDDPPTGLSTVPELHPSLFDFQRDIAAWALRRGRAALFAEENEIRGELMRRMIAASVFGHAPPKAMHVPISLSSAQPAVRGEASLPPPGEPRAALVEDSSDGQALLVGHSRALNLTGTEAVVNGLIGGAMKASLDAGLVLERAAALFGRAQRQTANAAHSVDTDFHDTLSFINSIFIEILHYSMTDG